MKKNHETNVKRILDPYLMWTWGHVDGAGDERRHNGDVRERVIWSTKQ